MDDVDKKILSIIQKDATIPLSELSKKVGISKTPSWNRIRKMEEEGIIKSKVTVLDNKKINLSIVVFLSVSVSSHSEEWLIDFQKILSLYDQIIEVYRLTGSSTDYLLKININKNVESLNVSNSTSVVFHFLDLFRKKNNE